MTETRELLIWENGAHTLKVGRDTDSNPRSILNAVVKSKYDKKRVYVGNEFQDQLADKSSLYFARPCERGYIVNWEVEQQVWQYALRSFGTEIEESKTRRVLLTDPNYVVPAIRDAAPHVLFDVLGFSGVAVCGGPFLLALDQLHTEGKRCALVVDVGHSFVHVVPFFDGQMIEEAIIRIDVGGKALTNQLKQLVSFRQLDLAHETYVVEQMKEDACFVSTDLKKDLKMARIQAPAVYVLPDFESRNRGQLQQAGASAQSSSEKSIKLATERFLIPELLFCPSDIGLNQIGVVEAVVESISRSPENLRAALVGNVALVGGCTLFPGFVERFVSDLRASVDDLMVVKLADLPGSDEDRDSHRKTAVWRAAQRLASRHPAVLEELFVSRDDWISATSTGIDDLFRKRAYDDRLYGRK